MGNELEAFNLVEKFDSEVVTNAGSRGDLVDVQRGRKSDPSTDRVGISCQKFNGDIQGGTKIRKVKIRFLGFSNSPEAQEEFF